MRLIDARLLSFVYSIELSGSFVNCLQIVFSQNGRLDRIGINSAYFINRVIGLEGAIARKLSFFRLIWE